MMGNLFIFVSVHVAFYSFSLGEVSSDSFTPSSKVSEVSDTFIPTLDAEIQGNVEEIQPTARTRGARKTDRGF